MREAVVILPPDVRAEQVVERGDRPPPRDLGAHLQPLRVLVEHRVDDVDERLVAVEEAVPARQQIALEPALAEVLGEDLHHSTVGCEAHVGRLRLGEPAPVRHVEHVAQPVRGRLVGPEEPEVVRVLCDHVAEERAEHPGRFARGRSRLRHVDRVVAEVGQNELSEQKAAVCVGRRAHPALALRRQVGELGDQRPVLVEQLLRLVAPQPVLEHPGGARGCCARRSLGPDASARSSRLAGRRSPSAQSSPSECGARSSASAAASTRLPSRGRTSGWPRSRRARRPARRRSADGRRPDPRRRSRP